MPKSYSVTDARDHLPQILDDIERGADVHLTRRGRNIAVVVSAERFKLLRGAETRFRVAYADFLTRHALGDLDLDRATVDSLRDRRPGRSVRL
jgi:prevent-host-death family protein